MLDHSCATVIEALKNGSMWGEKTERGRGEKQMHMESKSGDRSVLGCNAGQFQFSL